jgi:hypothetical protein
VYPKRKNGVVLPLEASKLRAWCKALLMWPGAVAKHFFGHVPIAVRQGRQRRDAVAAGDEQLGRYTAGLSENYQFICIVIS